MRLPRSYAAVFFLLFLLARAADFPVGTSVDVLWGGTWYQAKVIAVENGKWKITYDGYASNWDEVVGADRIRLRAGQGGPSPVATPATPATATAPTPAPAPKVLAFPERPPGKPAGLEGTYLRVESWYFNGSMSLTNQGWFFTKEGRVSLTPTGGFNSRDFNAATVAQTSDGVYWIDDNKLTVAWANGTKPTVYDFEKKGDELRLNGLAATRVEGFKRGWRCEAYYEGGASVRGGGSYVASSNSLRLHPDGTFDAGAVGAVSASSAGTTVGGGSTSSTAGTYDFEGYTLTLKHTDGRVEKRTVFAFGDRDAQGTPEYIWREGTMLRHRDVKK